MPTQASSTSSAMRPPDRGSLVARAKVTSGHRHTAYAASGSSIFEVCRRGLRARIRQPDEMILGELGSRDQEGEWILMGPTIRHPWQQPTALRGLKRGLIREFSHASRRRFVYRISNWHGADRLITMTTRANEEDARRSGRSLGRFLNWARSRGLRSYVWVRERQERGAIHYHLWTAGAFGATEAEIRTAWLDATGEGHDYASIRHAVQVVPWKGQVWYAVSEGAKRIQKRSAPATMASSGRYWGCSHDVSRAHLTVPLGIDGTRWFRKWLRKIAPGYEHTLRRTIFHSKLASLKLRGEATREARTTAWEEAQEIAATGRRWLERYRGGYLMLDRLRNVETRLLDAVERIVDRDPGRGVSIRPVSIRLDAWRSSVG